MRHGLAALLLFLAPLGAAAQEPATIPDLPHDVEERMRSMQRDPSTHRLSGPATIEPSESISGNVAVSGPLTLAGRIDGDLLVTEGDLLLIDGAVVTGDVLVVGGAIRGVEVAEVHGTMLSFGRAPKDEVDEHDPWDEDADAHEDDDDRWWTGRHDHDDGGIDLGLSVAGNYNRVEGLPVMFGPVIRTAGPNRLTLSAQAVWRTEPSRSLDDEIGYRARVRQSLFDGRLALGGEVSSLVQPVDRRGLNSTEASLAAVLFHSDLHDYYGEESWALQLELNPASLPVEGWLVYRQAEHATLEVSDPWSLLEGDDPWRPQPVIAPGDVSTLLLGLSVDTRDDEEQPLRGLFGTVTVEHALDQELVMPGIELNGTVGGGLRFDDFTTLSADLRAYLPVNRNSMLALRGFAAGTVEEAVLPPQFQRALGGIGTLPGFSLFEGACGARDSRVHLVRGADPVEGRELSDEPMLAAYGCDRVALGQLEYRGGFDIESDHDDADDGDEHDHWRHFDVSADWTFFVDVARGWSYGNMTFVERGDTETMADVGIGVLFDQVGVYVALPVTGEDQSLRAAVRLQHRF